MYIWKIGSSEPLNIDETMALQLIENYGNNVEIIETAFATIYHPTKTILPQELIIVKDKKEDE